MAVLVYLAERPGQTVSNDELLDQVWSGRTVVDNAVYQAVAHLRKALGDDAHHPRFIETIPKKGYRLIAPVTRIVDRPGRPTVENEIGWRWKHRDWLLIGIPAAVGVLIVSVVLIGTFYSVSATAPAQGPALDRSVAVLPFLDLSSDKSLQHLGDGFADELIHTLSNLPDLRVAARTSSFRFRDNANDVKRIGKMLNVRAVLEGSIRSDNDRLLLTAQLVDTRDGFHIWSRAFDLDSIDPSLVQQDVAAAVADWFRYKEQTKLATAKKISGPKDLEAYELYLLGVHFMHKRLPVELTQSMGYFEQAISSDPDFARAWAALSLSSTLLYIYDDQRDSSLLTKAESAALQAIAIDDQVAEGFAGLGLVRSVYGDYAGAESAFLTAIQKNPNYAEAHFWLASTYNSQLKNMERDAEMDIALQLNPLSAHLQLNRFTSESTDEENLGYFAKAIELEPDNHLPYLLTGRLLERQGRLDEAIPYYQDAIRYSSAPGQFGRGSMELVGIYLAVSNFGSAAHHIRLMREAQPNDFWAVDREIQLSLAREDFMSARDLIHQAVPNQIGRTLETALLAFYEMLVGDLSHARGVHERLAELRLPIYVESMERADNNLLFADTMEWGMLGAVNLAWLYSQEGRQQEAGDLLEDARAFIHPDPSKPVWERDGGGSHYVLAQIAAIEGNNEVAIDYFRKAIDLHWSTAWYARIDPITEELRADDRFSDLLKGLESDLSVMQERIQLVVAQ